MIKNKVLALSFFAGLHLLIFSSAFAQVPKKIKTIIESKGYEIGKNFGMQYHLSS